MNSFFNFVAVVIVGMIFVGACTDKRSTGSTTVEDSRSTERQILASRLQQNDGNRNLLFQTIEGRRAQVAYLEQQITRQANDIRQFRGRVEAYMMDHKMAIAAIVVGGTGLGVALNEGNTFTPDEEFMGGVVAFIAVAYALANAEEVAQVADQLIQADAHFKRLDSQLAGMYEQLRNERIQLQQEEQQLAALNQQSDQIRQQLAALG